MVSFVSPVGAETTREAAKLTVTQTALQIKGETPTSAEFCCKNSSRGWFGREGGLGGGYLYY